MTIRAKIESGRVVDIPEIAALASDPETPNISSRLISIDRNNARVEHYKKDGDRDILCGRSPILHREEITEEGYRVIVASGTAPDVEGTVVWERDSVGDLVREKIESVRKELRFIIR